MYFLKEREHEVGGVEVGVGGVLGSIGGEYPSV